MGLLRKVPVQFEADHDVPQGGVPRALRAPAVAAPERTREAALCSRCKPGSSSVVTRHYYGTLTAYLTCGSTHMGDTPLCFRGYAVVVP